MPRPAGGAWAAAGGRLRETDGGAVHEIALAEAVWRQVAQEMGRQRGRLTAIHLVVGEFSGTDPESLEFALGLGAADTAWAGAAVHIRTEPLAVRCRGCGREFGPEGISLRCPGCGSADVDVTRGNDLRLESLEVADDDGQAGPS